MTNMDTAKQRTRQTARWERLSAKKLIKWLLIALLLAAAAIFGYRYWRHSQLYASTDDAYVGANTIDIAAQISGQVIRVHVKNNQPVQAGALLFEIDTRPYRLALDKAMAQLRLARQSMEQQEAAITAAQAQLNQRKAELDNAHWNNQRTQQLVRGGFLSQQGSETSRTQVAIAEAALRAAQANLDEARKALGSEGDSNAAVRATQAAANQARLDLEHTRVTAPTIGTIANMTLRPGDSVQPNTPLFSLISSREYWVDANFKETELEHIHPGQTATITIDMYPDHPFRGVVESVSGGSGTAFSLLPPQNATGNWVKVTQRVPVRVRVIQPDPRYPLRVGTTATVEVSVGNS